MDIYLASQMANWRPSVQPSQMANWRPSVPESGRDSYAQASALPPGPVDPTDAYENLEVLLFGTTFKSAREIEPRSGKQAQPGTGNRPNPGRKAGGKPRPHSLWYCPHDSDSAYGTVSTSWPDHVASDWQACLVPHTVLVLSRTHCV
jgi:hypothetical protein